MGTPSFTNIWLVDFEFSQADGERPNPICVVAKEFNSKRIMRQWLWGNAASNPLPPYQIDGDCLFVAYYVSAELSCHIALKWPMPPKVLDLCAEFKCHTSGITVPNGRGLLGALGYYGLPGIESIEKESMRNLAIRGGPYTKQEQAALLDYCQTDVESLELLLTKMAPEIDWLRALLRGRYMAAVARMEWNGTPIDDEMLGLLRSHWVEIQASLIKEIDRDYGIYDGHTFKSDRWAGWCERNSIPWPCLGSGAPDLKDDTFREMAKIFPQIMPIKELRTSLSQLRLNDLAVGKDNRNRCLLSAFSSKTSRNQPSTSKFIFGPAAWLRNLIKPEKNKAIAYIDYEQQEFGIAAALSKDSRMMEAYLSGDPYLTFAKQAGAVPVDATKASHSKERELYKVCALAVQYGMGEEALGRQLALTPAHGRELLRKHKDTYPDYWHWSDSIRDTAQLQGYLQSAFGWRVHLSAENANPRSMRNFPLQANGAEMLRIACIALTERGIKVCAPIHDALLVEDTIEYIKETVALSQKLMTEASAVVLAGFEIRTEAKIVRYPDRYSDKRGEKMWNTICELLENLKTPRTDTLCTAAYPPHVPVHTPLILISSIY